MAVTKENRSVQRSLARVQRQHAHACTAVCARKLSERIGRPGAGARAAIARRGAAELPHRPESRVWLTWVT